jgi:hypothetical protein
MGIVYFTIVGSTDCPFCFWFAGYEQEFVNFQKKLRDSPKKIQDRVGNEISHSQVSESIHK